MSEASKGDFTNGFPILGVPPQAMSMVPGGLCELDFIGGGILTFDRRESSSDDGDPRLSESDRLSLLLSPNRSADLVENRQRLLLGKATRQREYTVTGCPPTANFRANESSLLASRYLVPDTSEDEKRLTQLYDILEIDQEKRSELGQLNTTRLFDPEEFVRDPGSQSPLAASFKQLLLWITDLSSAPHDHKDFLLTFPSFETPANFMASLFTRYYADINVVGSNIQSSSDLKVTRDRIIRLMSSWMMMEAHYQWENNNTIAAMEKFIEFVHSEDPTGDSIKGRILTAHLDKLKGKKTNVITSAGPAPAMIIPKGNPETWQISDIDQRELARQLSVYHREVFERIGPMELFATIWSETKSGTAKNINELTAHFSKFSQYVQFSILQGSKSKERAKLYWFWVSVANECRKVQNFHAVFAIMSGLTHRSVTRLPKTMKLVEKANKKDKKMLEELLELTDISSDYANYRALLMKVTDEEPCVPFIGCFQRDLVYVQEGFPNKVNGLINFKKSKECVRLVAFISQRQTRQYNFKICERIRELVTNLPVDLPDTVEMMKLSMRVEKKQ